jgi:hypothetical protein
VSRRRAIAIRDIAKLLKTGLLVVALILQGYFSQVHNHNVAAAAGSATAAFALAAGGDDGRSPAQPLDGGGHDLHCFICHLTGLGSASLLPPAIGPSLAPPRAVAYVAADDRLAVREAPAAYSSRAPPSLFVPA